MLWPGTVLVGRAVHDAERNGMKRHDAMRHDYDRLVRHLSCKGRQAAAAGTSGGSWIR